MSSEKPAPVDLDDELGIRLDVTYESSIGNKDGIGINKLKTTVTVTGLALVSTTTEVEYDADAHHTKVRGEARASLGKRSRREPAETALRRAAGIPWLPAELREAAIRASGRSVRKEEIRRRRKATYSLWLLINGCKRRLRRERDRFKKHPNLKDGRTRFPRRGRDGPKPIGHEAAIEEVAREEGITVAALKKRIERHHPLQFGDYIGWF